MFILCIIMCNFSLTIHCETMYNVYYDYSFINNSTYRCSLGCDNTRSKSAQKNNSQKTRVNRLMAVIDRFVFWFGNIFYNSHIFNIG